MPRRREWLAAVSAGIGSLSGCMGLLGGSGGDDDEESTPSPGFDWYYSERTGRLRVVHLGGPAVRGDRVSVQCGDASVDVEGGRYEAGDVVATTGECSPGQTARLVRDTPNGTETLDRFELTDPGDESVVAPSVAVDWQYDAETGRLRAVHDGGDTVRGSVLFLRCGTERIPVPDGTYGPGDTILETTDCPGGGGRSRENVDVRVGRDGVDVRLMWRRSEDGNARTVSEVNVVPGTPIPEVDP